MSGEGRRREGSVNQPVGRRLVLTQLHACAQLKQVAVDFICGGHPQVFTTASGKESLETKTSLLFQVAVAD